MAVQRMDHVGIVVADMEAAVDFFAELGLERQGRGSVEGELVDRIIGLEGVRTDLVFMRTPDGHGQVELVKYHSPPHEGGEDHAPANTLGLRHITFAVDDIEDVLARLKARGFELVGDLVSYESSYKLCYVRGPAGVVVELAEGID